MDARTRATLLGLVLLSALPRVSFITRGGLWRLGEDVDGYLDLAGSLADEGTYTYGAGPTAYRPPLYPLLLAGLNRLVGLLGGPWSWQITAVAFLHVLLGAATMVATWRIGVRWGFGAWAGAAAALVALDPLLIFWASRPMTETLAATLLASSVLLLGCSDRKPRSACTWAAGLVLGLGMLCRTTIWAFVLLAVPASMIGNKVDRLQRVRWATVVLVAALATQLPWVIRNWLVLGRPVLTTTHGGYTLLLGNNDVFYDTVIRGDWGRPWPKESLDEWQRKTQRDLAHAWGDLSETELDAHYYRMARDTIRARPEDFWRSVLYRLVSMWRVYPRGLAYPDAVRVACALFYVPELLLALLALIDRRTWQWPLVLLPTALVSFTLVHAIYWSDMRMRAPIMPAVAILAAMGAQRAAGWACGKSAPAARETPR